MFLLKPWSESQNLIKRFQAILKTLSISRFAQRNKETECIHPAPTLRANFIEISFEFPKYCLL